MFFIKTNTNSPYAIDKNNAATFPLEASEKGDRVIKMTEQRVPREGVDPGILLRYKLIKQ